MKLIIDIPEEYYNALKEIPVWQCPTDTLIIKFGTPLPDDCEILTKEAYSDLCLRASKAESEE